MKKFTIEFVWREEGRLVNVDALREEGMGSAIGGSGSPEVVESTAILSSFCV